MTHADYFEGMYATSDDPWSLATSEYELRKYDLTVASLPRRSYRRAFEPGCSIGVLSDLLAGRCQELLAIDAVPTAIESARSRATSENVTFSVGSMPGDWPEGPLDLIVISELLYFLDADDRHETIAAARRHLDPHGHLVLVHWRHTFDEAECTGDQAHREAKQVSGLPTLVRHEERDFLLEVLGHE